MPDNQRSCSPKFPLSQTWSIDRFRPDESEPKRVIRKIINSAIYVEKSISNMPPLRKKSPIFLNSTSDSEFICRPCSSDTNRTTKISRSSGTSPKSQVADNDAKSPTTNSSSDVESQITVKSNNPMSRFGSELRLSLTSLSTSRAGTIELKEKEEIIKKWLQKKDEERKKRELEQARVREEKEKERQLLLEKERDNFKKWLAHKKREEEKLKKMKELEEDEIKLKESEKEKKRVENEICFNIWLRRKKRMELERKIQQKLSLIQVYEEKQHRIEENERAFNEWLKNSKNKPKPIPLNQGLQSLCSSSSVTYINPVPWIPNIEMSQKPVSQ